MKLGARHAPADWSERARIIALSWDGLAVAAIAAAFGCQAGSSRLARRWDDFRPVGLKLIFLIVSCAVSVLALSRLWGARTASMSIDLCLFLEPHRS
jgi:hypothetical protein